MVKLGVERAPETKKARQTGDRTRKSEYRQRLATLELKVLDLQEALERALQRVEAIEQVVDPDGQEALDTYSVTENTLGHLSRSRAPKEAE